MKKCTKCGEQKPLSKFQKRKESKDGYRNECVPCRNAYSSVLHRKIKYNITEADFLNMLKKQDNKCGICFTLLKLGAATHVDHCHTTNKVRGILCQKCNQAIGLLKESREILKSALVYLEKYSSETE